MRLLFIGDIVGPAAGTWLIERLPVLRSTYRPDVIVANAENIAFGTERTNGPGLFGMTTDLIDPLLDAGVDVITSGNHAWDTDEADTLAVHAHPRVLRPVNMPDDVPGKGSVTIEVLGEPVTVVNLATQDAVATALPPRDVWTTLDLPGTVIVDLHAESVIQKHIIANGLDGEVAAVLGTHTHEASLFTPILQRGTAFVPEVGMTGHSGGAQGMPGDVFRALWNGEGWGGLTTLAPGPLVLGAVVLDIEAGRTTTIQRIH